VGSGPSRPTSVSPGAIGVLVCTVNLLRPRRLGFSVRAGETYRELFKHDILEQPGIDLALADAFDQRRVENTARRRHADPLVRARRSSSKRLDWRWLPR
jgi:predicted NAD/FAD-binding protein